MIIECKSCSRKFTVKDHDIPNEGRRVQCGYCSTTWHQLPISRIEVESIKKLTIDKKTPEIKKNTSIDEIGASDGKTYKFLGGQWAELLPSGKTGLFAKKKIGKELDQLTGRKTIKSKKKKIKKEVDPSSISLNKNKQLPDIPQPGEGMGFFGYIFLIIIIGLSIVGVLRTFENDLLNHFPEMEYIFQLLDKQLEFFSETVKNMIIIVNDLIGSY